MATIDIKLKTYEQLQFEIMKLNTDIVLKDKEIERLNNIINELEKHLLEYLDEWQDVEDDFVKGRCLMARDVIHDIYELKEGKNEKL